VNVDLSNFVGANANPALHQMVAQMISDRVTVTVNERDQAAADRIVASQLAGFQVQLPRGRSDVPKLTVAGRHAFALTVDRARLQAIISEAGRPDLVLPAAIDGASVAIALPAMVRAQYGNCPGPQSATANVATPSPASTEFSDCTILTEGPSPSIDAPAGLDVPQLIEMGLELAGMNSSQAGDFLRTVNWQSTLGLSVPRSMRSYQAVSVNGVRGTLLNTGGRRGPTYVLVWATRGQTYSMTGFSSADAAVPLASSLQ
jgi:hypothetical protein